MKDNRSIELPSKEQWAYKTGYMRGYIDRIREEELQLSQDSKNTTASESFSKEGEYLSPEFLKGYRLHIKDMEEKNAISVYLPWLKLQAHRSWKSSFSETYYSMIGDNKEN